MHNDVKFDNILTFIASQQKKDGSFRSQTSSRTDLKQASDSDTIFLTSLILSSLTTLPSHKTLDKIKSQACDFLLTQKSPRWSFNYWKRASRLSKVKPYPDDLDDTFCALASIFQVVPKTLDGQVLAKIVTLLTATEEKEGGPYRTWIVPPDADKAWLDVDLAVNANVAYFLALQDIFLPPLRKFLLEKIQRKDLISPYYPSVFPVVYFLARYLSLDKKIPVKHKKDLQHFLLAQSKKGYWDNPLHTALATNSLLRLGAKPEIVEKAIAYLSQASVNGDWPSFAFCRDPVFNKTPYFAGSSSLTAAFCLETISLYEKVTAQKSQPEAEIANEQRRIYEKVSEKALKRFAMFEPDLQKQALAVLSRTLKSDKDKQIVLLPYYFSRALDKSNQRKLFTHNYSFIIDLGLANLYGWMAYRIYDDFLDGEGVPAQLSVANVCLRELTIIFSSILPDRECTTFFNEVMDVLDNANTWEISHCRGVKIRNSKHEIRNFPVPDFSDYSQLASKSLGHTLGPLAILFALGYTKQSQEVKNLVTFFKYYLIARQLSDDAHDWEEDLKRGQVNAVGAMMLGKLEAPNSKSEIDENDLQKIFWLEVFPEIAELILSHCRRARKQLGSMSNIIAHKELLESILVSIEQSAERGKKERDESLKFLKAYESPNSTPA